MSGSDAVVPDYNPSWRYLKIKNWKQVLRYKETLLSGVKCDLSHNCPMPLNQINLVMFAHTVQYADLGDKILIIVGSGHKYLLHQYFKEAQGFEIISPLPYLQ